MNKAKLKAYAPQARKDFIAAVTARAHQIGLAEKNGSLEIAPAEKSGDFVIIAGQSWPAKISRQRDNLITRIEKEGFTQTMEAVAYTWFNRFAALRYMEIHDYLSHGYRALSSREGGLPEILNAAPELAQNGGLPGLNAQRVIDLKLAGDKDGELYRLTLIAQCNALAKVMPFLFERIDNETELLLPDNLLLTDSVIAKLVEAIPEQDWQEVEIVGWLYQFYISEKKDQVIGKVVKSEDIPAATQLFTPNWIVQYLVQNSVGRLWLMANPASLLKSDWPYYIEPAEQTPEVQAQLDALIQSRIAEDGGSLNPETITVIDPACGSGHILVEAYEVLKAIYLERGYQLRNIPRLILEKNLYGLDIDDRAAQMAGFALLMKARADDRRLFDNPPKLNVLALQESKGLDADEIIQSLKTVRNEPVEAHHIRQLIDNFANAKTFGSLIQIPPDLNTQLMVLDAGLQLAIKNGDLIAQEAALNVLPLVRQAQILGLRFDAVVANPPYMGGKFFNANLKAFVRDKYPNSVTDIYGCFIDRAQTSTKVGGYAAFITIPNWMSLYGFSKFRNTLLRSSCIETLVNNGRGVFGSDFGSCAFVIRMAPFTKYMGTYKKLYERPVDVSSNDILSSRLHTEEVYLSCGNDFLCLPDTPISFHISERLREVLKGDQIGTCYEVREGLGTRNDQLFIRAFWEVSQDRIKTDQADDKKWLKIDKAGQYRKWQGNKYLVMNWANDGYDIKNYRNLDGSLKSRPQNTQYFFKEALSWGKVGLGASSFRYRTAEHGFTDAAPSIFGKDLDLLAAYLNSSVFSYLLTVQGESVNVSVGIISKLPLPKFDTAMTLACRRISQTCFKLAEADWDSFETSWGFQRFVVSDSVTEATDVGLCDKAANPTYASTNLEQSFNRWQTLSRAAIAEMQRLEEENNRLFIDAYGLQDELSPEVPEAQITLVRADREKDSQRLISYAIGCMMGRYSLDDPGLIYASAGNIGFDPNRYNTFPADADGIVPITDELWFEDDAANRINEFLLAVWDAQTLEENRAWLAESLGQKGNETPQETIRRYIAGSFYKNHLQTYKKRPIYWLFSSGKQGAFQALVYLHRYNESTLARMRAEYVVPLTGKIQARIDMLKKDAAAASSNAEKSKLDKDIDKLGKKYVELLSFDEKLRHYADLRIQLDLDDGVKVNYGKFGDLLAEVKAVTGGKDE
jgi:Eco57I restriction-modification methylase